MEQKAVSVVGAGLVGSLAAVFFAKRGYDVHVYEARPGKYLLVFTFFCFLLFSFVFLFFFHSLPNFK